jgi:glutathione S-transferase
MQSQDIRVLGVEGKDLNAKTARHLASLFAGLGAKPAQAREVRGRFVLSFPDYESDRRPMYAIPEIREFVRALDAECPYAAYFLHGDPTIMHIQFYLLCLVPLQNERWQYDLRDLIAVVEDRYEHIAAFCRKVGDDENLGTDGLLMNLPPEALAGNAEASAKVLKSMKPALEALRRDFNSLVLRPDGRAMIRGLLGRAAILSGLDPGKNLDEALLNQVLKRL